MSTREDFEAWIDNPHKLNRRTEPGFTEEYEHPWTLGAWAAYQAATSRQESKIKALVDALHMYQKAGVGSSTDYPAQWTAYTTSLLAIEAAKETP